MTVKEVKAGLIGKLQTVFPTSKYKYYSKAVTEKYDRPCFFTSLLPSEISPMNNNVRGVNASFYIDYMQEIINESEMLNVVQKTTDEFGLAVFIGERAVKIEGISWDFDGVEKNHLQITVDLFWTQRIKKKNENLPLIGTVEIKEKLEV